MNQPNATNDIQLNSNNSITTERKIWEIFMLKIFVILPTICQLCGNIGINVTDHNTSLNPYVGWCTYNRCRKIYYLRDKTFFSLFPKTNISTILYIIKLWISENKNAVQIYNKIKSESNNIDISIDKIREILRALGHYIAHYKKDSYSLEEISTRNVFEHFAVDESDFVRVGGKIFWVIGIINTHTKKLRLELSFERDTSTMKKIIKNLVQTGNIIVTDGWSAYLWLDLPFSGYIHSKHNHGAGDFWEGYDSTSHIESVWNQLKNYIKSMYTIIPSDNFILYLKESEFRRNINHLDFNKKILELFGVLN